VTSQSNQLSVGPSTRSARTYLEPQSSRLLEPLNLPVTLAPAWTFGAPSVRCCGLIFRILTKLKVDSESEICDVTAMVSDLVVLITRVVNLKLESENLNMKNDLVVLSAEPICELLNFCLI